MKFELVVCVLVLYSLGVYVYSVVYILNRKNCIVRFVMISSVVLLLYSVFWLYVYVIVLLLISDVM